MMLLARNCSSRPAARHSARASRASSRRGRSLLRCQAALLPAVATSAQQLLSFTQPLLEHVTPNMCFHMSTSVLVLTYPLMMFFPRWKLTQLWVKSPVIPLVFSSLYCLLLVKLFQGSFPSVLPGLVQPSTHLPSMAAFATLFKCELFTSTAWLHLVVLDFLQARYVWADGLDHLVPTAHSLLLCFMMGPLGMLSHMLTRVAVTNHRRQPRKAA